MWMQVAPCWLLQQLQRAEHLNNKPINVVPGVLCLAVTFPATFAGRRLCCVRGDGALVDDLHAGTPVFSALSAAADN